MEFQFSLPCIVWLLFFDVLIVCSFFFQCLTLLPLLILGIMSISSSVKFQLNILTRGTWFIHGLQGSARYTCYGPVTSFKKRSNPASVSEDADISISCILKDACVYLLLPLVADDFSCIPALHMYFAHCHGWLLYLPEKNCSFIAIVSFHLKTLLHIHFIIVSLAWMTLLWFISVLDWFQSDMGGSNLLDSSWTSYLKARINCSIPGDNPLFYNFLRELLFDGLLSTNEI